MFRYLHKLIGLLFIVSSLVGGWFAWDYKVFVATPLNIGPEGVVVDVIPGMSLRGLAESLSERGIISHPSYFVLLGRLGGMAEKIRAGEYQIDEGSTPDDLLKRLVSGEVIQHQLTVVEGWTFQQMLEALWTHDAIRQTLQGRDGLQIMAELGKPGLHPEGQFAPDTYQFPRGTSDLEFLRRAHKTMQAWLETEWPKRADNLPYETPYDALIMASIIEKETALGSEREKIAGVFVRRLQRGMRLQTDPTVIYGMGENFDGNIRRADLRRDTPYNTYTRHGLPPTPIALPSLASIHAALHPASGKALYFVAKGDGSHHFSATLDEHLDAVRKYQLKRRN
ncbi:MAG: endolytic transglycosylase MltG [Gammaproteobacteria bacterium]